MKSIAEIFENSNHLLNGISNFVEKYIGSSLLRRCNITKIVDDVTDNPLQYPDNPFFRFAGISESSPVLEKVVKAKDLLIDKLLLCFSLTSAYRMFKTDSFYRDYKKILSTVLTFSQRLIGSAYSWKQQKMLFLILNHKHLIITLM